MYKLYELFSDNNVMETKETDLSWLIYIVVMVTIFALAV
jgi:hypothetical protein